MSKAFQRVAVIDIGKTNAKVVVVETASGREIAVRKTANHVLAGPPYPHFDVDGLWDFILSSLANLAREPGFDAVSITTHGACAALLDLDGGPFQKVGADGPHRLEWFFGLWGPVRPPKSAFSGLSKNHVLKTLV